MKKTILAVLLFATGAWAQTSVIPGPSKAGIPFSPTMPYSVNDVPNRTVQVPGSYNSGYYYGNYGYGYGYGYNGYSTGYGPAGSYAPYRSTVYQNGVPGYRDTRRQNNPAPRAFPSAAEESSLGRDWDF